MIKYRRAVVAVAALAFLGSACSSDDAAAPETPETAPSEQPAGPGEDGVPADSSAESSPTEVVIDEEVRQSLDVAPGSAVIPGSVESVRVDDLSAGCAEGVEDLRALMSEYESVRQVPPDGTFEAARNAGQTACSEQEWADFYTQELAGWIYAAAQD